jgi:hypothetical protein
MFIRSARLSSIVVFALSTLLVTSLAAQQPKVLAPHKPVPPRVPKEQRRPLPPGKPGSMVGGLWMTDANFKSSIYLKNVVETSAVTVTPVLYLSNGKKYTLPDVTLEPAGTAIVDINAALEQQGISSWATLSGYAEIQYTWPWEPLCATIRVMDAAHSLIFTYGLRPSTPEPLKNPSSTATQVGQAVEGMWWKQERNVTGFVSLANTSADPLMATVLVSDDQAAIIATHTLTVSPHGTKIVKMPELDSAVSTVGGIRVTYSGPQDALDVNGGLQDRDAGYSAILPFASGPVPSAKTTTVTVAELGLMVGAADPMMSFPAGTHFTPYSVLRNVSDTAISVAPIVWWMEGGSAHSAQLQPINLLPGKSQSIDLLSQISAAGLKNFNGSVNLVFDAQQKKGGLVMASGSVDQTNTYVFEVSPRAVVESVAKSLSYWSTKNGDDTMVTLWNPADEAQDLVFKLFFSGGHYLFPIHLSPRATHTLNVSEILHSQIPDSEGNLIPPSIQEGSAKILGSRGDNEHILVSIDAGTYNVRKATCGQVCFSCDGYTSSGVTVNGGALNGSFTIDVDATQQASFVVYYDTGEEDDDTDYSYWSSSNTSVVTVDSSGVVTGKGSGTGGIEAQDTLYNPVYIPYQCFPAGMSCPISEALLGGGATATSGDATPVITGISPSTWNEGSTTTGVTISGQHFGTNTPTLNFSPSSGITYSLSSHTDTSIVANITVASNTPSESVTVSVTSTGYNGNGFVGLGGQSATGGSATAQVAGPVPTSAQIVSQPKTTYNKQKWTSCDGTQSANNEYGYMRCVTYQIYDQDTPPNPIAFSYSLKETLTTIDSNITVKMNSGSSSSNDDGQFLDMLALVSGSAIPTNACNIVKQTIVALSTHTIRVNCIKFGESDVTITDVTSNPNSCSKPTYHC